MLEGEAAAKKVSDRARRPKLRRRMADVGKGLEGEGHVALSRQT